jgi:hypothetical protein
MSWGETVQVTDLEPSRTATVNYRVREGGYSIEVVFRSGKRLRVDNVYMTSGVDYQDQITVTSSEIQLVHTPIASR